jgi:hypothetical protein
MPEGAALPDNPVLPGEHPSAMEHDEVKQVECSAPDSREDSVYQEVIIENDKFTGQLVGMLFVLWLSKVGRAEGSRARPQREKGDKGGCSRLPNRIVDDI